MSAQHQNFWPSARHYAEAMQFPSFCFSIPELKNAQPAVDRLGMPLVTSGQFAYVYKLKANNGGAFAVRCFRGYLGDRERRYKTIDGHLEQHRIHALASFDYEPEGILVMGKRFPILVMEWVDGQTLDVYIEQVINKPDVIKLLANQWLNLIADLREANISHGDLQHGNIIVERGHLRLVDLDGIYVPTMKGWTASEVGHQHYQHPKRDEKFFNSYLDNFSALVIYVSLISIAEKPSLWKKYHDENLLFIKNDFRAPEKSALLKEIKEIGGEPQRLAEILEQAAKDSPYLTPSLLELVEVERESNLPVWMTEPTGVDVEVKTREDKTVVIPRPQRQGGGAWTPWQGNIGDPALQPGGMSSNTVQTIFGGSKPATLGQPSNPTALFENTFFFANEIISNKVDFAIIAFATVIWFGSICFSPWAFFIVPLMACGLLLTAGFVKSLETRNAYNTAQQSAQLVQTPGQNLAQMPQSFAGLWLRYFWNDVKRVSIAGPIYVFFIFILWSLTGGLFSGFILLATLGVYGFASLLSGYSNANYEYKKQQQTFQSNIQTPLLPNTQQSAPTFYQQKSLPVANKVSSVVQTPPQIFIGNAMFGIYHKENCEWVKKIPPGRRVIFSSADDAEEKDYNACHICFPQEDPKEKKKENAEKKLATVTPKITQPTTPTPQPLQPTQSKPVVLFIGNRLLGIYHKPECEWAKKIPQGKRISFFTEDEAKKEKYRACHVCSI